VDPVGSEVGMDARRAVGPARLAVERLDLRRQLHIGPGPRRQRSLPPRVVSARGDTQRATHGRDAMERLMCGHELETLDGIELVPRANQAAVGSPGRRNAGGAARPARPSSARPDAASHHGRPGAPSSGCTGPTARTVARAPRAFALCGPARRCAPGTPVGTADGSSASCMLLSAPTMGYPRHRGCLKWSLHQSQ